MATDYSLNPFLIRASFESLLLSRMAPKKSRLNPFLIRASFESLTGFAIK